MISFFSFEISFRKYRQVPFDPRDQHRIIQLRPPYFRQLHNSLKQKNINLISKRPNLNSATNLDSCSSHRNLTMLNIMAYVTLIYHDVHTNSLLYHCKLQEEIHEILIKRLLLDKIYHKLQDWTCHLRYVQRRLDYRLIECKNPPHPNLRPKKAQIFIEFEITSSLILTSSFISSKGSSVLDACIAIGPTPGITILLSSSSSSSAIKEKSQSSISRIFSSLFTVDSIVLFFNIHITIFTLGIVLIVVMNSVFSDQTIEFFFIRCKLND